MVPPQSYIARLEDKIEYNSQYTQYSFELVSPNKLSFKAGQYISLKVSNQGERRAYSICSTPDNDHQFDLLVENINQGLGSELLKSLEFGAEVEVLAPMGMFTIPDELTADHLIFVATGSGIAPFKSMIEDQLRNKQDQRQITLHWGMRQPESLFWLDEWQSLADSFDNFHFHPVLSRAADAWTLCRGRVTDCLNIHDRPNNGVYFLCGNQGMIKDTTDLLLTKGIKKELILTEKFY